MKQNDQTSLGFNVTLAGVCLLLFVVFASFLVWNRKTEAAESKRLQQETESSSGNQETQESGGEAAPDAPKPDAADNAEPQPAAEENPPQPENVEDANAENTDVPQGIALWGDEFFTAEEDMPHLYRTKLEQLLGENGYSLAMENKMLDGAGTLSMMKMAGVPQENLDAYIAAHQEAAAGAELPITETGIRDLTEEQIARNEADYIPVIMMGYYGGWNKNPAELVEQQQRILDTFGKYKDKFIIIGVRPQDGTVDIPAYEQTMKDTWGEHYISTIDSCDHSANTYEGQEEIGQLLYEKLTELGYIEKKQEG